MRKKPLVFEGRVNRANKTGWLAGPNHAYLADLVPSMCNAPAIPRALLACLKPGKSHKVRITVERIDD